MAFETLETVKKDLIQSFDGIDKCSQFDAFCKIGSLLTSKAEVLDALKLLESDMSDLLVDRLKEQNLQRATVVTKGVDYFKNRQAELNKFLNAEPRSTSPKDYLSEPATYPAKDKTFSHLLSDTLAVEEEKGGFAKGISYLWSGLTADAFLTNLKTRRHFKDYGATPHHGEYTHRIQWYVVSKQVFKSSNTAAAYATIADYHTKKAVLWDFLFDRADNTTFKPNGLEDFRCPMNFHDWLRKQDETLPLLSGFLKARHDKRMTNSSVHLTLMRTPALKLYKKVYGRLSENQQGNIAKLMSLESVQSPEEFIKFLSDLS